MAAVSRGKGIHILGMSLSADMQRARRQAENLCELRVDVARGGLAGRQVSKALESKCHCHDGETQATATNPVQGPGPTHFNHAKRKQALNLEGQW